MKKYVVGVDVGGTNIKLGLVRLNGKIVARSRLKTGSFSHNKMKLIRAIIGAIQALLDEKNIPRKEVKGIGIGMPGPVDAENGVVKYLPNIPGWKNVPLAKMVAGGLNIPAYIDNDVNVITLAEWKFGAGKGCDNLMCITIGTGVGGGLILNGKMYRGEGFVAGELGHALIRDEYASKSYKDGYAHFEHYVGHRSLLKKAQAMVSPKIEQLQDLYPLVKKKNKKAVKFYDHTGRLIGNTLVGVVNLLNPRLIIIGGGVSNHFPYFIKALRKTVNERAMTVHKQMVKVVHAKLSDDAGILGALILVKGAAHA